MENFGPSKNTEENIKTSYRLGEDVYRMFNSTSYRDNEQENMKNTVEKQKKTVTGN